VRAVAAIKVARFLGASPCRNDEVVPLRRGGKAVSLDFRSTEGPARRQVKNLCVVRDRLNNSRERDAILIAEQKERKKGRDAPSTDWGKMPQLRFSNSLLAKIMKTRIEARDRAKELALKTGSTVAIRKKLEEEGLGGLIDRYDLDAIVAEAAYIRRLLPGRPKTTLPRIVGTIAVVLGVAAMWIAASGPAMRRHSPGGYGLMAVILGVILIVKPSAGKTDL
jgi:hypothetical protein